MYCMYLTYAYCTHLHTPRIHWRNMELELIFSLYFILAKFGVAAVPGGGIIVISPILESQFGFSGQMTPLIYALYMMFDPIITSVNIMGNGAFAIAFKKFYVA